MIFFKPGPKGPKRQTGQRRDTTHNATQLQAQVLAQPRPGAVAHSVVSNDPSTVARPDHDIHNTRNHTHFKNCLVWVFINASVRVETKLFKQAQKMGTLKKKTFERAICYLPPTECLTSFLPISLLHYPLQMHIAPCVHPSDPSPTPLGSLVPCNSHVIDA